MRRTAGLLLTALLASGCGSGTDSPGGPGDGGPASASVRFLLFGDPTETAGYQQLAEEFEKANDGVDVNVTPVPTQDDLLAKLTTSFAGGQPPDVFLINYRKYGQFAARDALTPVQDRLDSSDVLSEEDFADTALDPFRFDGETLTCLPQNVSSLEVYYNVDMFEAAGVSLPEAGWSWDDFLSAAQALTKDGVYGVGTEPSLIRMAPFVWSAGGEVVDDQLAPTKLTLGSGAGRRGLDFFLDLQTEHQVAPPEKEELSQGSEDRFLAGQLGMYLDSRKAVPSLREIEDFTWDVAPLPVAPGGEPATILHGDAYCLPAAAANQEAAWRFVEYANSTEGQTILARSGRTVPSRLDVARSGVFLRPDAPPESSQVFVDAIPDIRAVPHTATWSEVEKAADDVIAAMYYGRLERDAGLRQLNEVTEPLFGSPPG